MSTSPLLLATIGLTLISAPAHAATLVVSADGTEAFSTITDAIAAAASGDTIEVNAGTYTECIEPYGKNLTVVGAGPTITVVDGTGVCNNTAAVWYGEALTVQDLSLANTAGRGGYNYYSTLTLENVAIDGAGQTDWWGGALYLDGGTTNVVDSTLENNVGSAGGAIGVYAYAVVNIDGSTVQNNEAVGGGGGAIYAYYDTALTITDSVFDANVTAGQGGAVFAYWLINLTTQNSTFSNNSAVYGGGAIEFDYYGDLTLDATTIEDNVSESEGGAIYTYIPNYVTITDSRFARNRSTDQMGGMAVYWPTGVDISGSTFTANSAPDDTTSGALYFYVPTEVVLSNNLFCGNSAGYGGAIYSHWGSAETYTNNRFVENSATREGGAIYRSSAYTGEIINNTFAGNTAGYYGGAYMTYDAYAEFTNNAVVGTENGNGIYAMTAGANAYSTVEYDGWWENQVIDGGGYFWVEEGEAGHVLDEPLFVDWTADDDCENDNFRLATSSPYRDAGDPDRLDRDGTRSDIGAYGGESAPLEDWDGDGYDTSEDCVDTDDTVFPGAPEIAADGVDQDCDGADWVGDTADTGGLIADTSETGAAPQETAQPNDSGNENDTGNKENNCSGCSAAPASGAGWVTVAFVLAGLRRRNAICGGATRSTPSAVKLRP